MCSAIYFAPPLKCDRSTHATPRRPLSTSNNNSRENIHRMGSLSSLRALVEYCIAVKVPLTAIEWPLSAPNVNETCSIEDYVFNAVH